MRLSYRGAYDWPAMRAFLAGRAIDGVEQVEPEVYRRTFGDEAGAGVIEVRPGPGALDVRAIGRETPSDAMLARVRRVFDLDADLGAVHSHLRRDPLLDALIAARPGLRAPGGWDGFELAVRAVLGQQISVEAARRLGGRLVALCGQRLAAPVEGLSLLFPTPDAVLATDLRPMPMPGARKTALKAIAEAVLADPALFARSATLEQTIGRLKAVRGIGEWTAHYIALRAVREPDAFPASDIGLLRGAAIAGVRPTPAELTARAEAWRPWRAYAAQHLWAADPAFAPPVTSPA